MQTFQSTLVGGSPGDRHPAQAFLAASALPVEALIDDARDLLQPVARAKAVRLEFLPDPGLPELRGDRDRLLEVITSLVTNAVQMVPAGGCVTVSESAKGQVAEFVVSDSGPGITAAELPRIFDRHRNGGSQQVSGAGPGLAIARELVEAHGGHIEVQSMPGLGTTFRFTIPFAADHTSARGR